ncbi:iron-containing alcohol dehydrogenase [Actinoplanes sp. RD1]|uniref:iron-containing alcohol dehydrogenase n=1 Tax=Actinoplanes sp. RD1 TaxID=3064538 RepID=UPI0027416F92|nr:iron-containing alcohol dehydrogenase [Actinoplanes sp. RD1]
MAVPLRFDRHTDGQEVAFGAGVARTRLAAEIRRLGARRVLLVAGSTGRALVSELGLPLAGQVNEVRQHVPADVAGKARARAAEVGADLLLSIGGGAATGTAKAIALTTGLPILAVPTTYAGSEVTPVWGLTEDGHKTTGRDARVRPRTVLYDPDLTASLPGPLSVASALNALAHCVDALWAPGAEPVTTALALEGVRALANGLPQLHAEAGRESCLYGAYLAGLALAGAGSGLHHRICHILGGAYDLPHAELHAVVLPHVLAFNAPAVPELAARLTEALGPASLSELYERIGAPRSLRALGLSEADLPAAALLLTDAAPPGNPRPFGPLDAERLLSAAWAGTDPAPPAAPSRGTAAAREEHVTDQVLRSFDGTGDARLRELMRALVRHAHAFVRDTRLTEPEWQAGIDFLTRTGQRCDDRRQEFILLSDVLGVSMLTVAVNQPPDPRATEATVFGPFFVGGAPEIPYGGDIAGVATGRPCWVDGRVRGADGEPVPGARVDVWEADDEGRYDVQYPDERTAGRGFQLTGDSGEYGFWCVTPTPYPIPHDGPVGELLAATGRGPMRAAHLHFMVTAPGYHRLVTHIFVCGDAHQDSDAVFGVKESLIVAFDEQPPGALAPAGREVTGPWTRAHFDLVLARATEERR